MVPRSDRTRLHEVLVGVVCEAGAHEHVHHVVDQSFYLPLRTAGVPRHGSGQVGVAAVVVVLEVGVMLVVITYL